ncbi:MAG: nucleotide exchange factor GrpE [Chloroflexi bacterium]|nr:nucleotide exchange factor GrpE [Chloroflexota bacterium]
MTDEERPPDAEATPVAEQHEPQDIEGLQARVAEEKEKAQTFKANWQRAAADMQNLKRRMEQERSEVGRLANASLVINLLPLMDDLERALHEVDVKLAGLTWIDGIRLIYRKFEAVLQNAGVTEIEADGQQFDPNVHEAISEAPGEEGRIVSVVQRGYKLGDRVIRPAMVVVGKGAAGPPAEEKEQAESEEQGAGEEENKLAEGED